MFNPVFKTTNKIVQHIAEISAARELILNAPLLPQLELKLQREAIIKMAHHSTSIEGNPLTLEQVKKLLIGNEVAAWQKDKDEVLNYVGVLEYIDKLGEKKVKNITEEIILKIHQINTKNILPMDQSGYYRKIPVAVVDRFGEVVFQPPPVDKIASLMKYFILWLNNSQAQELYPVILSGISHYEFVRIHPFVDGNGRTARALSTLILYLKGFDTKRFFALDDYYNEERERYYGALQTIDQKTLDMTQWLEYFCEGVAVSMNKVKDTVLQLSLDRRLKDKRGQVFLNERQIKILRYLQTNPRINSSEIQKMFNISREMANRIIRVLIEQDLIVRAGKGKATYYELI